jgi:arylsulfatase A-like enzyme
VPLLVKAPGLSALKISSSPFSLIHLAPTLLEAVGIEAPVSFQGRSRWRQISAGSLAIEPVVAECAEEDNNIQRSDYWDRPRLMAVREGNLKLVIRFSDQTDYLFDLKNDPEEHSPLPDSARKSERARLLKLACEHLRASRQGHYAASAVRARLRDIRRSIDHRPTQSGAAETVAHG